MRAAFPETYIALSLLLIWQPLVSQSWEYKFHHLGTEQGFPTEEVSAFLKDQSGFVWFGSPEGLIKYDGHRYWTYYSELNDTTKLAGDYVWNLFEDRKGRIWVFTGGGINRGLNVGILDPEFESLTRINVNPIPNGPPIGVQHASQNLILEDEQGVFWIKSMGTGLYRLEESSPKQFKISNHRVSTQYPESLAGDSVSVLYMDQKQNLWVGTMNGLYSFDRNALQFSKIQDAKEHITVIQEFSNGELWVNYESSGLYLLDKTNNTLVLKWPESNETFWWSNWRYALNDEKGSLWMIKQYNGPSADNSLDRFDTHQEKNFRYLREHYFATFEIDSKGSVWVPTTDSLVYRFDQDTQEFSLFSKLPGGSGNQIFADRDNCIWISGSGLHSYHPSNDKFTKITSDKFFNQGGYSYQALAEDAQGHLLVAPQLDDIYSVKGLFKYKLHNTGEMESENILDHPNLTGKEFGQLVEDQNGNLWATFRNGAYIELIDMNQEPYETKYRFRYQEQLDFGAVTSMAIKGPLVILTGIGNLVALAFNEETNQLHRFQHHPDDTTTISNEVWVNVIIGDDNTIWLYNQDAFEILNEKTLKVNRVYTKVAESFGIISTVLLEANNRFWIACSRGLMLFEPLTGTIHERYSFIDGHPAKGINHMKKDVDGNLWLATSTGLVFLDTRSRVFKKFNKFDGLPSNYLSLLCLRKNGEILIGADGLMSFKPESAPVNNFNPRPLVTELTIGGKALVVGSKALPANIAYLNELTLSYHQNLIGLSYSALSYANPAKNQYAYYLDGLESDWNYVGNQTFARYAGLQPGEYTFNLKASNNDGLWNETPTQLKITILPPWWATWWAYALYTILFLGSVLGIYRFQMNRKLEQAETKRLREMDEFKTRFYTNITHEFRTPLTVILGVADQIELRYQKVKNLIKRNALNVLQLVNQLLDLSKLESGMLRLNLQQGDIGKFIKYVAESFHSLAEIKQIDIHFRAEVPELIMDFDADKMMNILSNLLSNAIKFTPDTGHISIVLSKKQQQQQDIMLLRVSDTGVGIAEDQLENIFDRFYQVDASTTRAASGTGIGLALTRELVRLMGGEISVKSTLYQGTEFTVKLPITNEAEMIDRITPQEIVEAPLEKEDEVLPTTNGHAGRPVALIVEDSIDVVYYLRTCLQNDYSLRIANNGQEGIEKALEATPDIIISDVMMPEKNGYQLTDTLKNDVKTSHIPIILLTAKASEEDKMEGLGVGADAYLTKPFNVDELKLRIRNLIRERKKLWQRYNQELSYQPQQLDVSTPDQKFLSQALEVLEGHKSDSEFNSAKLQQELGVSRTLLHVKLKALTGQSTTEFIRTYRLKYAATLILQDFGNIAEIAYESGFNDQSYFTKSFKKHFGVAPSEYKG